MQDYEKKQAMITYQVKIKVDESVEKKWLLWMKTEHVPDVIGTGLIRSFQILKSASEDQLYHFDYHFNSIEDYHHYRKEFAPKLKAHPLEKFPNQFTAERELWDWV